MAGALPEEVDYVWTQVDRDIAGSSKPRAGAGEESYVTPYKVFAWNISGASGLEVGKPIKLRLASVTAQRSYVGLFLPTGYEWQRPPTDLGTYSTIRELLAALLNYGKAHGTDIFPPEFYDISRPDHTPSGGLPIERLIFDFWGNSAYRQACSSAKDGKPEREKKYDLLGLETTVDGKTIEFVMAKNLLRANRSVAPVADVGAAKKGPMVIRSPARPAIDDYEKNLKQGLKSLGSVGFGRCDGAASQKFDHGFWKMEADRDPEVQSHLGLLLWKLPHDAVDQIILHPEKWSLDCGQFVQVLQMYARMHTIGPKAWNKEAKGLQLRIRDSQGLGITKVWTTDFKFVKPPGAKEAVQEFTGSMFDGTGSTMSVDDVLAAAPVGSLVMWTKPNEADVDTNPWRNENGIKIGDDQYWGHGLVSNPHSRKSLEDHYSKHDSSNVGPVFVATVSYVSHTSTP